MTSKLRMNAPLLQWSTAKYTSVPARAATLVIAPLIMALVSASPRPASAQILPDSSLGERLSSVIPESDTRARIEGGLIRNTSLFHSFEDFNIDAQNSAYFANPNGIETIFSRVTGNNISKLLGTLGVSGEADLFFLNPNGIIFGPEASLDISGSFTAATAESFEWTDGTRFGAINPTAAPMLMLSTPPGLQFGQVVAEVRQNGNLSVGQNMTLAAGNLAISGQLQAGQSITLSALDTIEVQSAVEGNNITVRASDLFVTDGGLLEISTISEGLSGDLTIAASGLVVFSGENEQIAAISGAYNRVAQGTTEDAGNIAINARRLELLNGALISASTRGEGTAGQVTIRASDAILISGEDSAGFGGGIFSQVGSTGQGSAGGIFVDTGTLIVEDGGELTVNTLGQGDAGLLEIVASDTVSFDGVNSRGLESGAFSRVGSSSARGDAGGVEIKTGSLSVTDGASISSNTFGTGNAGSVIIQARDTVTVAGGVLVGQFPLGASIDSQVGPPGVGTGGEVSVTARTVVLNDGFIDSGTFGQGDAGRINIVADSLEIINGGRVIATTVGDFDAGDLILTIKDRIMVIGNGSGILSEAFTDSTGDAGNIFIDPQIVVLREGARIAVSSRGTGRGGNIDLLAGQLMLNDNASIFATTASNQGGNITLSMDELLLLSGGSNLSASAGTAEAGGDGGNIRIATEFLVATQDEDNNITANAFLGRGGNIVISATGVYGIEPSSEDRLVINDIAASSTFGLDGVVELDSPDVDPTEGTTQLSTSIVIPAISQRCNPGTGVSSFVMTGRGGIPLGPEETIASQDLWEDNFWDALPEATSPATVSPSRVNALSREGGRSEAPIVEAPSVEAPIVEAQSWQRQPNGDIQLIANPVPARENRLASAHTPSVCSLLGAL